MSSFLRDVCASCFKVTYGNDKVVFEGVTYHRQCMTCSVCTKVLTPDLVRTDAHGTFFCPSHFVSSTIAPLPAPSPTVSTSSSSSSPPLSEHGSTGDFASDEHVVSEQVLASLAARNRKASRTGWLVKQGAVVKNWKRRFCVLIIDSVSSELRYYKPGQPDVPRGSVDLTTVRSMLPTTAAVGKVHGFRASPGLQMPAFALETLKRKWIFVTESERERDAWIQSLRGTSF